MMRPTPLILILLSAGLFYTFISPQYADLQEKKILAGEYQSVLENISTIAETRDRLLVNYESIPKHELDRLAKALPDNIDTVRLALDLDSIASRYGISIKNVQIENNPDKNSSLLVLPEYSGAHQKVTISFGLISTYGNFMRFLADLEKSLRIMDVRSVSFRATENGLYDYRVMADTYWLK